ncbi:uncharacterized protein CANTADRAFT_97862 [Suhomyces tanzawaensis NRRL Y-17324]|uniref:BZIP domain-containing protein n=1 Tax=Suhomyces tanzawaensis NRRL Y-17324 TaxID=984487 RepID=A0A1E4SPH5_9ASCO|nr:uncharacterized protein CANTADRAFT_97862 [Suhomyces tanzawaensis NRRL Y-17324]ODV81388.1 hypothetical protein CANTADRAFT_97862 [Suhomyces tanzawaensis NRRL Y-17324]
MSTEVTVDTDATFKSTLPPRKRAKTKEEKEQRRVERILRNRRAAHASREKKRKHVEYLESYVVQLEKNLATLQDNFDAVHKLLPAKQQASLSLAALQDLKELKDKIHSNLTTGSKKSENEEEDDEDDESFSSTPQQKKRKLSESTDSLSVKDEKSTYYNYLSPVSINSPVNSPIDLTLTKNHSGVSTEDPTPFIKLEPTNVYDSMGQNSAAPIMHDFLDSFPTDRDGFTEQPKSLVPGNTQQSFNNNSVDDLLLSHYSEVEELNDFSSPDSTSFILDNQHSKFELQHQDQEHQDVNLTIDEFLEF